MKRPVKPATQEVSEIRLVSDDHLLEPTDPLLEPEQTKSKSKSKSTSKSKPTSKPKPKPKPKSKSTTAPPADSAQTSQPTSSIACSGRESMPSQAPPVQQPEPPDPYAIIGDPDAPESDWLRAVEVAKRKPRTSTPSLAKFAGMAGAVMLLSLSGALGINSLCHSQSPVASLTFSPKADAFLHRGRTMLELRKLDLAKDAFDRCLALDPSNMEALFSRAQILTAKKNITASMNDCDALIRLYPRAAQGYQARANLYWNMQKTEEALKDYTTAIELAPRSDELYRNRGKLYECIGQSAAAISDYTRAIAIDPLKGESYMMRAMLYANNLHDTDKAMSDLTQGIKAEPGAKDLYFRRGQLYLHAGALANALQDFSHEIEVAPGEVRGYVYRARTLGILGETKKQAADLAKADELSNAAKS